MSLVDYISKAGIPTKNLSSEEDINIYNETVWEYLNKFLIANRYEKNDIAAVRCAFDTACHYHRKERRDLGSPYIIHPSQVLERLVEQHHDYETLASAILHDTVESQGNSCKDKEGCLDEVIRHLNSELMASSLEDYVWRSSDVGEIVGALSKDVGEDFFQAVDQIFRLDEVNLMKALILKCTDRYVNTLDTVGYSVKEILYNVFKTFYVANEAKRYMSARMRLFRRLGYRAGDSLRFIKGRFNEQGLSAFKEAGSIVREYIDIRNQEVAKREYLMKTIGLTLDNLSAETNAVLDNQTNRLQDVVSGIKLRKRRDELKMEFHKVRTEVEWYGSRGGFDTVTKARKDSRLDGKMGQYIELIRDKAKRREHKPELVEEYLDCEVFKKLLLRVGSEYFREFFIRGLGGRKGTMKILTSIW